jgi:hypothetical protein
LVDLRTDAELAWLASLVRAVDLAASGAPWLVLSRYLDAGQADRLYGEAAHLVDESDFDYARAGARLLGADVRRFLEAAGSHTTVASLGRLLVRETDANQPLRLVQDARPADVDEALGSAAGVSEGVRGGVALAGHASIFSDFFDTSWRHVDGVDAPSRAPTAGTEPPNQLRAGSRWPSVLQSTAGARRGYVPSFVDGAADCRPNTRQRCSLVPTCCRRCDTDMRVNPTALRCYFSASMALISSGPFFAENCVRTG